MSDSLPWLIRRLKVATGQLDDSSSIKKILDTVAFARDFAHFEPDVIIIDAFDFANAKPEAIQALSDLARERSVELWISAQVEHRKAPVHGLPEPIRQVQSHIAVVVFLVGLVSEQISALRFEGRR